VAVRGGQGAYAPRCQQWGGAPSDAKKNVFSKLFHHPPKLVSLSNLVNVSFPFSRMTLLKNFHGNVFL